MTTLLGRCIAWQSVSLGSTALVMCGWYLCSRVRMRAHTQPPRAGVRSSHMLQAVIEFRAHARTHSTTSASRLNYISLAREACARAGSTTIASRKNGQASARVVERERSMVSASREKGLSTRSASVRRTCARVCATLSSSRSRWGHNCIPARAVHARALVPLF